MLSMKSQELAGRFTEQPGHSILLDLVQSGRIDAQRAPSLRQDSLHAIGPLNRCPTRAFDTGFRPGPFPDQAASVLPGLLTGLPGPDSHRKATTSLQIAINLPPVNVHSAGRRKRAQWHLAQRSARRSSTAEESTRVILYQVGKGQSGAWTFVVEVPFGES